MILKLVFAGTFQIDKESDTMQPSSQTPGNRMVDDITLIIITL